MHILPLVLTFILIFSPYTFFQNNAIPRYVIIIKGGRLDTALKQKIKDYFTREIKKSAHSTLFMELPSTDVNQPEV
ncbi:unnamed protein product, partial [marine sediment metagenome]